MLNPQQRNPKKNEIRGKNMATMTSMEAVYDNFFDSAETILNHLLDNPRLMPTKDNQVISFTYEGDQPLFTPGKFILSGVQRGKKVMLEVVPTGNKQYTIKKLP